jgi:2-polyprenyl-6-methoxyphenol hydroxylase-like FAD-dependent oxidoreductase
MAKGAFSQLRTSCAMTPIDEDDDCVYAEYQDACGATYLFRAKFLVGADGKTGFTRNKHLLKPRATRWTGYSSKQTATASMRAAYVWQISL